MLGFTVSIYLINKVYEDPVFCCLQSYHKNCLVSSYQSKVQWTLSLQSCITEKKVCNVYNQRFNIKRLHLYLSCVIHPVRSYPSFLSMKLLPSGWDTSLLQGYPSTSYQASLTTCQYPFMLLGPVAQKADNAIQWINNYPVDKSQKTQLRYPPVNDISSG